jgi:hypothetical protein
VRYSYESWGNSPSDAPEPADSSSGNEIENESRFSFSEDLKELEESLSMSFAEGMQAYHRLRAEQSGDPAWAEATTETVSPSLSEDLQVDAFARVVAEHVLASLHTTSDPIQQEMEHLQQKANNYYHDNRAMAAQIQRLLVEKEQLQQAITAYQLELSRFRPLVGNLHLKV